MSFNTLSLSLSSLLPSLLTLEFSLKFSDSMPISLSKSNWYYREVTSQKKEKKRTIHFITANAFHCQFPPKIYLESRLEIRRHDVRQVKLHVILFKYEKHRNNVKGFTLFYFTWFLIRLSTIYMQLNVFSIA